VLTEKEKELFELKLHETVIVVGFGSAREPNALDAKLSISP
jgi:hypothetical protein